MTVYVVGDIRSIQEYIFSSPRLYEMRGASALVSFFDHAVVPRLVRDHGGEVVSCGGGNFLARFEGTSERSEQLVEAVENAFLDLTGGHEIVVERFASDEGFAAAVNKLQQKIRRRKHSPEGVQDLASMPFLKRCESCGRETADVSWPPPGASRGDARRQWLGPACDRKRVMYNTLRDAQDRPDSARQGVFGIPERLEVLPLHPRLAKAGLPRDFEELVGDDDLATLVADGNDLGAWFADRDRDGHHKLSLAIDRAMETALSAALDAAFPAESSPRVQVLICGGDDLVVALPARYALEFTRALVASFEVHDPADEGRTTGLAAGLLLSRYTFPFRQAHTLAEELLHRAKARCREERLGSAIDLLRVTATHVRSLEREVAAREPETDGNKGWSYGAAGPYTREELDDLLELAGKLREVSPSQRGRLREILSPRADGIETELDREHPVPARVVAELEGWALRQEKEPFTKPLKENWPLYVRTEQRPIPGGTKTYSRWMLHDALTLAEAVRS